MSLPRWDDPNLRGGAMVRGALWLVSVVGEGNTFTKEQLRVALPGVAQADRRIRDLRKFGWTIQTNIQDVTLRSDEQRFVRAGVPVWDAQARKKAAPRSITTAERMRALAADGHQCVFCGVAAGEPYPDEPTQTAVLAVTRRAVDAVAQGPTTDLITQCRRCHDGRYVTQELDVADVTAMVQGLTAGDREMLRQWIKAGRRTTTALDRVWRSYLRLPPDGRTDVRRGSDL